MPVPSPRWGEIMPSKALGGYDAGVAAGAVEFLQRSHERPFLLVASFLNPHNICEWSRRLAGREQKLNCGEPGNPPPADRLAAPLRPCSHADLASRAAAPGARMPAA